MIHRTVHDRVVVLELDSGSANALDPPLLEALYRSVLDLDRDGEGGATVLTGAGRMFSAGLDLNRLVAEGSDYALELVEALELVLRTMIDSSRPTVAAINGHAIAGGCVLACGCDVRVAARGEARLGLTEMALGLPFPPLALEVVRSAIGDRATRRAVFSAALYSPEEALAIGLVDELSEPDQLLERALALAGRLSQIPRAAFELTKRQLRTALEVHMGRFDEAWNVAVRNQWIDPGTVERMRRFIAERMG